MKLTLDEYMRIYTKAKEATRNCLEHNRDLKFNRVFDRLVAEAKGGTR